MPTSASVHVVLILHGHDEAVAHARAQFLAGPNLLTGNTDGHWRAVRKGVAPAFSAMHMRCGPAPRADVRMWQGSKRHVPCGIAIVTVLQSCSLGSMGRGYLLREACEVLLRALRHVLLSSPCPCCAWPLDMWAAGGACVQAHTVLKQVLKWPLDMWAAGGACVQAHTVIKQVLKWPLDMWAAGGACVQAHTVIKQVLKWPLDMWAAGGACV